MTTPLDISVVIPAYNAAAYLVDAVTSVLEQTMPAREIIVVDDGSTDNTEEIVEQIRERITYIKQRNAGPAAARNRGIEAARHPWIAFLDADDQWTPDKLKEQVAAIQRRPELTLVCSDMAQTDRSLKVTVPSTLAEHELIDYFIKLDGKPMPNSLAKLMEANFIPTGTVLARRDALLDAGGFPSRIRYGEDLALWARVAAKSPIACLPTVHMLRRQHGNNATQMTIPLYRDLVIVAKDIREWCGQELACQGVDADALVARAWADFGYSLFCAERRLEALRAFSESLKERYNHRAFVYNLACRLPPPLLYGLRHVKQRFG